MLFIDIRNFFGGLDNVSDDQLAILIKDANERVEDDGIATTSKKFNKLFRYALGALLTSTVGTGALQALGSTGGTAIKKESVGDVSTEFKDQGINTTGGGIIKDLPGGGYEANYLRELRRIIGKTHILV